MEDISYGGLPFLTMLDKSHTVCWKFNLIHCKCKIHGCALMQADIFMRAWQHWDPLNIITIPTKTFQGARPAFES